MKYVLYYDSSAAVSATGVNSGFDEVLPLIPVLQGQGHSFEIVDTSGFDDESIQARYMDAIGPSVLKKYRIRQVFGSRRRSGWLFGTIVPALLVYRGDRHFPEDVFPHEAAGRCVTIKDYLERMTIQEG
jgi:hypothetical protein